MHVKETLLNLMKLLLKDKYPFKMETEIQKVLEKVQSDFIDEWMWRRIIEKMYDPKDGAILEQLLLAQIDLRQQIANASCICLSRKLPLSSLSSSVTQHQVQQFFMDNKITLG